jgi:hypothetical protein
MPVGVAAYCRRVLSGGEIILRKARFRVVSRQRMTTANVSRQRLTFRFVSPSRLTTLNPAFSNVVAHRLLDRRPRPPQKRSMISAPTGEVTGRIGALAQS